MRRKISAIIISIILSIVGIIPTMSITYAVSDNTTTETCIYRTSSTKNWSARTDDGNVWKFKSTLFAFSNGHIHIDIICIECPGIGDYTKIKYVRIGQLRFNTTYVAPIGKDGFAGTSIFTPSNKYSSFIEPIQVGFPGEYFIYYSNLDTLYNSEKDLTDKIIMSFELYVKEPYLGQDISIGETKIPFSQYNPVKTEDYVLGDVNSDGSVDGTDAGMVLREYAVLPEDRTFTEAQIKAGDINNDGSIDASDAGDILRYFAEKGAGYEGDDMELWLQTKTI